MLPTQHSLCLGGLLERGEIHHTKRQRLSDQPSTQMLSEPIIEGALPPRSAPTEHDTVTRPQPVQGFDDSVATSPTQTPRPEGAAVCASGLPVRHLESGL